MDQRSNIAPHSNWHRNKFLRKLARKREPENDAAAFETTNSVAQDSDTGCRVCDGRGWHWGWALVSGQPVRLRCPCVDRMRATSNVVRLETT